jgi:hypothetical protein
VTNPRQRLAILLAAVLMAGVLPLGYALAAGPTSPPAIEGPVGGTFSANQILSWQPLAGVSRYRVQVSTLASFSKLEWSGDV